jgi:small-conductance mechanosensitive channel
MKETLQQVYFNNTVQDYLISLGIIVFGMLILRVFRNLLLHRLKKWSAKTQTKVDDFAIEGVEKFGLPVLNLVLMYYSIQYLELSPKIQKLVDTAIAVVVTYFIARIVLRIVNASLESYVRRQENGEEKIKQLKGIAIVINIVGWILAGVFLFDNLGYNVTAIVTGLGIGGIAIALAAQTILGDLFNYFVIFFDRPFEVGDFIVVDDKKGTVEYIGLKTTRVNSLTGEQMVFSNSDLTNSRIHNFKRLQRRRIVFSVGVTYQTKSGQLKKIPTIIRSIIEQQSLATFDRSHFSGYGDFSLNFETVYFAETAEYNQHMDIQQNIFLQIFEAFATEGIEFAYPTQTVYEYKMNQLKSPDAGRIGP